LPLAARPHPRDNLLRVRLERDPVWGPVFNRFAAGVAFHVWEMAMGMSPAVARATGRVFGRLAEKILAKKIRQAGEQVARALGPGHEDVAGRSVREFGMFGVEVMRIPTAYARDRWRRDVTVSGEPHLRDAVARGKGVVAVSAHLGNWELGAACIGFLGFPVTWLLRPIENPFIQDALNWIRSTAGIRVVTKWGGLKEALHVLRRGEFVAMLVDQDARDQGVFVPFFGREASTLKSPALLSLRTGAPILPFVARREARGKFTLEFAEGFVAENTGDQEKDLERATARFTAVLEAWIRRSPEQWLWIHRRWKTQRSDEAAPPAPVQLP
jgi:KDO2-lipid IV(A) lauroyltransferase